MIGRDTCAIAIPVYKPNMEALEKKSFIQCLRVLGSRDIYLVTHSDIDLSLYKQLAEVEKAKIETKLFDKSFFGSVGAYNRLMLDKNFYLGFADYSYMLIYQLDAYVFSDDLDYWCSRGYDYIGAPWFDYFATSAEGLLYTVGNGGLSLRRVAYFTNLLTTRKGIFSFRHLPTEKALIPRLKFIAGGHNRIDSIIAKNTLNEDHFYCIFLRNSRFAPSLPSPEEAAAFAFERSPSYLYRLIGKLPMGCHAFEKNEYTTFWRDKIN